MAPDRRALFEAAYGALMIRTAPARRPPPPAPAESANSLSSASLSDRVEATVRNRP